MESCTRCAQTMPVCDRQGTPCVHPPPLACLSPRASAAVALHAQAVRERLAALSEERRHTVLQRHAELRALANGIEAIPSLDAEAAPEPLAKVRPGGPPLLLADLRL